MVKVEEMEVILIEDKFTGFVKGEPRLPAIDGMVSIFHPHQGAVIMQAGLLNRMETHMSAP
ncbi:hypothetical protein V6Z11_D05G219500 [Gossypium hirsutum]